MAFFYTASEDNVVSTATDILFCTVATDTTVRLWGLDIANRSDLGDASEETLRIGIYSGVTGGGDGAGLTEVALNDLAPAATAAWVGTGTASTGGTLRETIVWNIRQAGPSWLASTLDSTVDVNAANDPIAFRLIGAPADQLSMSYEVLWEEF